jgi:predicted amidophosphoribosyltransferase
MGLQAVLHLFYPPQCLSCDASVVSDFGLCGSCWRDTPFISGHVCDKCGTPLMGESDGRADLCDDCMVMVRPWSRGRAALLYKDNARKIVLQLKHGDRLDLARPAADWLMRAARPLLTNDMVVAPIPLHWMRLFKRRYNQAALLSAALAEKAGLDHCADLLIRPKSTRSQDGRDREARFANMTGALRLHPRRQSAIAGRSVLLVDDVMTSGATLSAGAEACLAAGAKQVCVIVLARVAKDA